MVVEAPLDSSSRGSKKGTSLSVVPFFKRVVTVPKPGLVHNQVVDNRAVSLDVVSAKFRGGRIPHHGVKERT